MELKLGAAIKKLRTERGITQEELANRMCVSFQAVSKWETNATTPDIAILPQLALFFGVSIDTLFSMNQDDYTGRISKMIRDEYSIAPENFLWAERYLKGMLSEENQNNNARILLVELYEHRENRDLLACGRLCEEGLLIEPSNIALIGKLTRIREKRDESDRLIEFFEALYSKNKQNDILAETLIEIYIKHGRCDDAASLMLSSKKGQNLIFIKGILNLLRDAKTRRLRFGAPQRMKTNTTAKYFSRSQKDSITFMTSMLHCSYISSHTRQLLFQKNWMRFTLKHFCIPRLKRMPKRLMFGK